MINPNTQIEPLREDLGNIIENNFLISTAYKRWLVSIGYGELWKECILQAEENRTFVSIGRSLKSFDAGNALTVLLNALFENNVEEFVLFISDLLSIYHEETKKYIDVSNLRHDMKVAGIDDTLIKQLDNIGKDETATEEVNPVALTGEQKVRQLENDYKETSKGDRNSLRSIEAYLEWHKETLLYLSCYYSDMNSDFKEFKDLDNSGNGHSLYSNFKKIYTKYNLLMSQVNMQSKDNFKKGKSPMVFISHSSKDKEFAEALVDLLESIGLDKDTLFCSSVAGYGLDLSDDIFETLRNLFLNHDLFMIFIHSPRYYTSAVSLNEMGAAWALRKGFCSILTSDMEFSGLTGVVNDRAIAIKVNEENAWYRLNELYDNLKRIFNLTSLEMTKWERKRDNFLRSVNNIKLEE